VKFDVRCIHNAQRRLACKLIASPAHIYTSRHQLKKLLLANPLCRELHNSGFANADAAAAQQAKQELAVAQGALKAKHDAYRVLQRVFSAWLSTVLSTDEVFEVFRTWVGQACNCTACQTQRAAAAAARAAAGDAAPEQAAAPPGGALFGGL
jgi:hypothetical protein